MNTIKKIFYLILISISIYLLYNIKNNSFFNFFNKNNKKKIQKTILGHFEFSEDIIFDGLNNNALLRMKKIDQGGPLVYFGYAVPFSRYDHCIGVWSLIKKFNGNIAEQLSGLFHDISHTAFSHVADIIFHDSNNELNQDHSYQDNIHLWYIKNSPAYQICEKYDIPLELLNPDNEEYTMLEQPLPDMCADRIEYNLHTALLYNILTEEDIQKILEHLHFEEISYYKNEKLITKKSWYFDNPIYAKKFALLPLQFIKTIWNAAYNMVFYKYFSNLIKYAFSKNYINKDQFHFGTDEDILSILFKHDDLYIQHMIKNLSNIFNTFKIINNDDNFDEILKGKFRGIDPLVKIDNNFSLLSEIDFEFNYLYNLTKKECQAGYKIKYTIPYTAESFYNNNI